VATGNALPQFILSTTNVASIGPQAFIQQLLQQNAFVVGCNSLLVASAGRSDSAPVQPDSYVATSTGLHAIVKAEVSGTLNTDYGTSEVCVGLYL